MPRSRKHVSPSSATPADWHADHETLGLYLLGDLSVLGTLETEKHLSSCRQCEVGLRQVEAVIAALRTSQ
jgi:hypothetical protein